MATTRQSPSIVEIRPPLPSEEYVKLALPKPIGNFSMLATLWSVLLSLLWRWQSGY
jgi:hypothetical protein